MCNYVMKKIGYLRNMSYSVLFEAHKLFFSGDFLLFLRLLSGLPGPICGVAL